MGEGSTYNETNINCGERKLPHHLTKPPFVPEAFVGRIAELQNLKDKLFFGDELLLLNGEGGIGKTTLASLYYHTYHNEYAHVAFILSEKNIANALLTLASPLALQFEETKPTDARLDDLLTAMAELRSPSLLMIDNANELEDLKKNSLASLLADLQHQGVLGLAQSQEVSTGYQTKGDMRQEKPEDIIAAMYDLGQLQAAETALLSVFAAAKNEIAILCERIGSYHSTTGNLEKALGFYEEYTRLEKELYDAYPNNVSFKNGLAISYIKLGLVYEENENQTQAAEYYKQAAELWSQLVRSAPQYVEFKKNLAYVQAKLAGQ